MGTTQPSYTTALSANISITVDLYSVFIQLLHLNYISFGKNPFIIYITLIRSGSRGKLEPIPADIGGDCGSTQRKPTQGEHANSMGFEPGTFFVPLYRNDKLLAFFSKWIKVTE